MRAATRGSWRWRLPRRLASPGGSVTRVVERSFPGRATPSTWPAYPSRTPHRGRLAGVSEPRTADIASGAAKDDRPGIERRRTLPDEGTEAFGCDAAGGGGVAGERCPRLSKGRRL